MILLTLFGKSCNAHMLHASGVYYSYMVSRPNFEFKKVIHNFWHQDTPVCRANSEWFLGTKWQKWWIYKNVSRIVKIVHSGDYLPTLQTKEWKNSQQWKKHKRVLDIPLMYVYHHLSSFFFSSFRATSSKMESKLFPESSHAVPTTCPTSLVAFTPPKAYSWYVINLLICL